MAELYAGYSYDVENWIIVLPKSFFIIIIIILFYFFF